MRLRDLPDQEDIAARIEARLVRAVPPEDEGGAELARRRRIHSCSGLLRELGFARRFPGWALLQCLLDRGGGGGPLDVPAVGQGREEEHEAEGAEGERENEAGVEAVGHPPSLDQSGAPLHPASRSAWRRSVPASIFVVLSRW